MKINRNDKCPCGSGKKYKRCCYLDPVKNAEIIRAASIAKTYEEVLTILS
ncbi:MAG: SEC-C domain-containing protein, partial [Deltaproteobacteria bacterium]|nr:SEC-C domain-containing protein [Deltaproteobacteria bacterium]